MNKALFLLLVLPAVSFSDSWLVGGQTVYPFVSGGSNAVIDPEAPLILEHNATNDNEVVNRRSSANLTETIMLHSLALTATDGVVYVDAAAGYNQMHEAFDSVTFELAERQDTNSYETFFLHVLGNGYTLSFATNNLDEESILALNVASNTYFSFQFVGPANHSVWYVTENHHSIDVPLNEQVLIAGLAEGLIFYTKFNESAQDETGIQTLRATNTTDSTAMKYTNGVLDSAAVFVATNRTYFSYTNSTSASLAPFGTNLMGMSMAWWEYKLDIAGDFIDVVYAGPYNGTGPTHTSLADAGKVIQVLHYVNDEYLVQDQSSPGHQWWLDHTAPIGEWVHMAFVFDAGGTADTYINGQWFETATLNAFTQSSGHFLIGNLDSYPHWTYNGYLDDLAMWNRKLSAVEVSLIYNNGSGREIIP